MHGHAISEEVAFFCLDFFSFFLFHDAIRYLNELSLHSAFAVLVGTKLGQQSRGAWHFDRYPEEKYELSFAGGI
jgi:hypothetical protein